MSQEMKELRALRTRPMPEPIVRGVVFHAPAADADEYIAKGWAEEVGEVVAPAKSARSRKPAKARKRKSAPRKPRAKKTATAKEPAAASEEKPAPEEPKAS